MRLLEKESIRTVMAITLMDIGKITNLKEKLQKI